MKSEIYNGVETPKSRFVAGVLLGGLVLGSVAEVAVLATGNVDAAVFGAVALAGGIVGADKLNTRMLETNYKK